MFEVLDFLSTIMPVICGLCIAASLILLIVLIVFRSKKKNIKQIKIAAIVCLACGIAMIIGTAIVLDAYGEAAYEQTEDYQIMQDSIDKTQEIISRNEELQEILEGLD